MFRSGEVAMRGSLDAERLRKFFGQLNLGHTDAQTRLSRFFDDIRRIKLPAEADNTQHIALTVDINAFRAFFEALHLHSQGLKHPAETANVWRVAGLRRDEVRNAAVLCWLLDARQSHGYGPRVLNALLARLKSRQQGSFPIPLTMDGTYNIARECYSFGDEQNRVDLMIDAQQSVIIIEVKINAVERPDQIRNYLRIAHQRAVNLGKPSSCVIYLTPKRTAANVADSRLLLCDWKDISRAIRSVIERNELFSFNGQALSQLAGHFYQI